MKRDLGEPVKLWAHGGDTMVDGLRRSSQRGLAIGVRDSLRDSLWRGVRGGLWGSFYIILQNSRESL